MSRLPCYPLRIYYDGACRLCAAEITHYLRRDRLQRLVGVDISPPDFDPTPLGLTRAELLHQLHAVAADGTVYRNVAAFCAIWQAFPPTTPYPWLARLIALPVITPLARLGYRLFARYRRYLPRRHDCSDGSCRSGRHSRD